MHTTFFLSFYFVGGGQGGLVGEVLWKGEKGSKIKIPHLKIKLFVKKNPSNYCRNITAMSSPKKIKRLFCKM